MLPLVRDLPGLLRACGADSSPMHELSFPFTFDFYLWSEPEALSLLSRKDVSASESARIGEVISGRTSMLSSDGADHRRRRGASNQPFTPKGLSLTGVAAVITEVVERRVGEMLERGEVRMLDETQALTLEILFRVLGVPQHEVEDWVVRYGYMLASTMLPKLNFPGSPYRRALEARRWVDERLARYVEQAKREPEAEGKGLVAAFVAGRDDEGKGLSEVEIFDNLRLLVLAGHETTASVMAWMVYYLGQSPELFARLLAEAKGGPGLPQTVKQMREFPLAEAVFREALRLHPPATIASRRTLEPMTLAGYRVPADTVIGIPLWLFNRDPDTFAEPERFLPDRWIRETRRLSVIETCAFGAGPHFCLGYHMAVLEGVQFAVALILALDAAGLRPETQGGRPREHFLPLMRPEFEDTRTRFVAA